MKDAPLVDCPNCGEPALKRLIGTGAGFLFKGSGFYITDYRSSSYEKKKSSEGGGGGGESKPAEAPKPAPRTSGDPPPKKKKDES